MKTPLFILSLLSFASCGYTFKQTENPMFKAKGIRTVYIAPVQNTTFKPGVETVLYNAILHKFSSFKRLRTTHNISDADAALRIKIDLAQSIIAASTATSSLEPLNTGDPNVYVASHYSASLGASFNLNKIHRKPKQEDVEEAVWSSGLTRSKTYQASTQLGVYGTTSHLINESEFDRALQDLCEQMSADAHDSMLQGF